MVKWYGLGKSESRSFDLRFLFSVGLLSVSARFFVWQKTGPVSEETMETDTLTKKFLRFGTKATTDGVYR